MTELETKVEMLQEQLKYSNERVAFLNERIVHNTKMIIILSGLLGISLMAMTIAIFV